MKLVRSRAMVWKIDPQKIGVLGYSAGSNLSLNLASHFDKDSRPDFVVLLCCWPNSGPNGRQTIADFPLSKDSPPAFIAHARDDRTAPPAFGMSIKAKYDELNVPAELFMCDTGGHGAFHIDEPNTNVEWKQHFLDWMTKQGLLKP
jgi:acetyl esterase/lipase